MAQDLIELLFSLASFVLGIIGLINFLNKDMRMSTFYFSIASLLQAYICFNLEKTLLGVIFVMLSLINIMIHRIYAKKV